MSLNHETLAAKINNKVSKHNKKCQLKSKVKILENMFAWHRGLCRLSSKRCSGASLHRLLSSDVKLSVDDHGICTVDLQKPPVNSLGLEFMENIISAMDQVKTDKAILKTSFLTKFTF